MTDHRSIPHLPIIVGACAAAIGGYAAFSAYAVIVLRDATMTGDIIGTWKSFAVLAFGFWLGSSSGGKANRQQATGTAENPMVVEGAGPDAERIPTREGG